MAIKQGRVTFQPHDFFQPNPQVDDDKIYVLRWILHGEFCHVEVRCCQRTKPWPLP